MPGHFLDRSNNGVAVVGYILFELRFRLDKHYRRKVRVVFYAVAALDDTEFAEFGDHLIDLIQVLTLEPAIPGSARVERLDPFLPRQAGIDRLFIVLKREHVIGHVYRPEGRQVWVVCGIISGTAACGVGLPWNGHPARDV